MWGERSAQAGRARQRSRTTTLHRTLGLLHTSLCWEAPAAGWRSAWRATWPRAVRCDASRLAEQTLSFCNSLAAGLQRGSKKHESHGSVLQKPVDHFYAVTSHMVKFTPAQWWCAAGLCREVPDAPRSSGIARLDEDALYVAAGAASASAAAENRGEGERGGRRPSEVVALVLQRVLASRVQCAGSRVPVRGLLGRQRGSCQKLGYLECCSRGVSGTRQQGVRAWARGRSQKHSRE